MTLKNKRLLLLTLAGCLLAAPGTTAAETHTDRADRGAEMETEKTSAPEDQPHAVQMHMGDADAEKHSMELQADHLRHRGARRYIDLYNVHAFRQYKEMHGMSLHWGITVSRPVGSWAKKETPDVQMDSSAVGVGPAYMVRWTKPLGRKWEASFDVTGALLLYNRAHPADTRSYDFMWRIGPRLAYKFNDRSALSIAYLGHHVSNGRKTRNPGYNGVGVSIGYRWSY